MRTILVSVTALVVAVLVTPVAAQSVRTHKAELRREVTSWLRARQSTLKKCPRCGGTGKISIPVIGKRGLTTKEITHKSCRGSGVKINMRRLRDLYRPYLLDATTLPGLGEKRATELGILEIIDDVETPKQQRARVLRRLLGIVRRRAQVRRMKFEQRSGGIVFATVSTTVEPFTTRWAKVQGQWYVVGVEDEQRLRGQGQTDEGDDDAGPGRAAPGPRPC